MIKLGKIKLNSYIDMFSLFGFRGRRGCNCMVFGFTTTCAMRTYHH